MAPLFPILELRFDPWSEAHTEQSVFDDTMRPLLTIALASARCCGLMLGERVTVLLSERHPDLLDRLRQRVNDGHILLLASTTFPVVLSLLPERDAVAQFRNHAMTLKRLFGVRPTGALIAHEAWDPVVPRILARAGLTWTVLDDAWLVAVGAPDSDRLDVEREGHRIHVHRCGRTVTCGDRSLDPLEWTRRLSKGPASCDTLHEVPTTRAFLPPGSPSGLFERRLLTDEGADTLRRFLLRTSLDVERLAREVERTAHSEEGPDRFALEQARRYLHRSQTVAGLFGDSRQRDRAWQDALRARRTLRQQIALRDFASSWIEGEGIAFDLDASGRLIGLIDEKAATNLLVGERPHGFEADWEGEGLAPWRAVDAREDVDGVRAWHDVVLPDLHVCRRLSTGVHAGITWSVTSRANEPVRGHLRAQSVLCLGGEGAPDTHAVSVELGGGREPLDERIELPGIDAVALVGWRTRVDLTLSPDATVVVEPAEHGRAHLRIRWRVELFPRDQVEPTVRWRTREVPHG